MQSQILLRMGTSCLCKLPAWAQIRATKNFSVLLFIAFTLHLVEIIHIHNMKKSLSGFEQITLIIVLDPVTKFELLCPAGKTS